MKQSRFIRWNKTLHKWPAVVIAFFAILFALSGIVLNHRDFFSSFNISRKLMPPGYQYKNWNLAGVRSSLYLNDDSVLIYGNTGIWLSNNQFTSISDFNSGFPAGIDKRKIYTLIRYGNKLVAATHFGLYATEMNRPAWTKISLPVKEDRLTDLTIKDDTLIILSRHLLMKTTDLSRFEPILLPSPEGYEKKTGLFNTLWELHSGELFGKIGIFTVDTLGFVVILLSVTGLLHFFFPGWIRRRKKRLNSAGQLAHTARLNLKWHNVVGYIFVLFLIINTTAGIFLRPPLLIPIANKQVGVIPYTHLDQDNPWFDKLRRVSWNDSLGIYLFSTSEGFYVSDETLNQPLIPAPSQPPVSIMGCNVLEQTGKDSYLVGSFTGLYLWKISSGAVMDFFSGEATEQVSHTGRPISDHMVAGWIAFPGGKHWWFDYNKGAVALPGTGQFPEMTTEVIRKTPISLWNAALEIHTGRIFEHLVGPFYILFVPLAGICLILVLFSGFFVWWKLHRKRVTKPVSGTTSKV